MKKIYRVLVVAVAVIALGVTFVPAQFADAASADVRNAQNKLNGFGINSGTADGAFGAKTARALCTFRSVAGLPINRSGLDGTTAQRINEYAAKYGTLYNLPAPANSGQGTYLVANKTCQTMVYVEGYRYKKVINITTGTASHETPTGTFRLGSTQRGWSCSTLYSEGCRNHTEGKFASLRSYGNMYNKRNVTGAVFVHGSTDIRTSPASHGCIRVSPADSDWMYDNVGNGGAPIIQIVGKY